MNPTLRHVSFRQLGGTEIHLRYLEEDRDLEPFLGVRARDVGDLDKRSPGGARRLVHPEALSAALLAYAERHGAPEPVLENARAVAGGEIHMVITGQQPGVLGGPLYTMHKAATAIRLARELSEARGTRVVPIFWNHTDDHDLDEVSGSFLVNGNQELQRVRLPVTHSGQPIRNIAVGHLMDDVLGAANDLLPQSEFRDWAFEPFKPRHPDEHLGDGLARLLFQMFGKHGLLVIEPRDLPAEAFDVLERWRGQTDEIRDRIRASSEHLGDLGLDVTIDPSASLMFQITGGRRVAMADEDPLSRATDLSPGALLRPLWQDACLPTVGFVVGPGEMSYLAIVGRLYPTLGVPAPCLVPRASLTLVERSQQKLLKRFGWDIPELGRGVEALAAEIQSDEERAGAEVVLHNLSEHIRETLGGVVTDLKDRDPQVVGPAERARGKLLDELRKLSQKVRNSRQNREGTGLRQIRRLCNNLRPRSRMQERILPVLPYLVAHGESLADWLVDAADPFAMDHGVLEL